MTGRDNPDILSFIFDNFTIFIESLDLATFKADTVAILLQKSLHFKVAKSSGRYLWYTEAGVTVWVAYYRLRYIC